MKTLAVIGGDGMVGSDLVNSLSSNFSVTPITKENYSKFINKSFDICINANGNSKRFLANKNVLEDFNASTVSVYKSIFDFKYSTYIYISSSDIYKDHSSPLTTSEFKLFNSEELSSYGLHKYLSEIIVKNNCPNYMILRLSMVLGENLKKGPIFDVINKKSLLISPSSRLQMITTKELSNLIKLLLSQDKTNTIVNVGGKGTVDFKNIQNYFSIPITFSRETEKQVYEMNVDKLNKLFPLKTSEEYLREFLNNQEIKYEKSGV